MIDADEEASMAKKPKKEKPKAEWRRMPEAEAVVADLVHKHHRHLERAKIVVLGKPKAGKRGGKVNVAKAKRATPELQALIKEIAGEEVHYVILVGLDAWDKQDTKQRRIVLDHELCHFAGQDLDTGKWGLVGHDVEEFSAILARHGAWNWELRRFCQEAKPRPARSDRPVSPSPPRWPRP
jgi:hypothetical protein